MNWKEFLKPRWVKFVLPVILLIFLIALTVITSSFMNSFGNNTCFIDNGQKELQVFREKNDSEGFAKRVAELKNETKIRQESMNANEAAFVATSNDYLSKVNPLYPVPCVFYSGKFCASYLSEEQNNCLKEMLNDTQGYGKLYTTSTSLEYRKMNYFALVLNMLVFFVVAYVISCISFYLVKGF